MSRKKNKTRSSRKTRFGKNFKKARTRQEIQEKKESVRISRTQESCLKKISCLISQDSVYMNLARKSRSVFSDKNLGWRIYKKNLV